MPDTRPIDAMREDSPVAVSTPVLREAAEPLPYSFDFPGKYTVEDYDALPEEQRVELIDGAFYDMAAPSLTHQTILLHLSYEFRECIKSQGKDCRLFIAPCDVQLDRDEKTMIQPDLFVICGKDDRLRDDRRVYGAPDLVVEILSSSSRGIDLILKLNKYKFAGVHEYWIVDPENAKIFVYNFDNEAFYPETYTFDSRIPVHLSKGTCQIDFAKIHQELI